MVNTDREVDTIQLVEPLVRNIETLNQLVAEQKATIDELEQQLESYYRRARKTTRQLEYKYTTAIQHI